MTRVTVDNYKSDSLYPRITRAVSALLRQDRTIRPVDVLIQIGLLSARDLQAWQEGRVPYLERVIRCNLNRNGRILRILLDMQPVPAEYRRSGTRKAPLRFSKTGDPGVERAYSCHLRYLRRRMPWELEQESVS